MKILLIPSAALMPREMRRSFGELPTGLFPLGDRPMLWHLCQKYRDVVDKIYVITYRKAEKIDRYLQVQRLPLQTIKLDKMSDLGYTVAYGLHKVFEEVGANSVSELYINFADSLVEELPLASGDSMYCSCQDADEAWTFFQETDGRLTALFDKEHFRAGQYLSTDFKRIFVGVFGFKHPMPFLEALDEALGSATNQTNIPQADGFYRALQKYSQMYPLQVLETVRWFDVGHNENYVRAQTKVAARSFNAIEIDERRGMLTKTSDNKAKLVNEIRWYLRMPNKLQYLLPRIYDYSLDMEQPSVTMEYYGYHTLHESLLYGDLSLTRWHEIFSQLKFVLKDMESFRIVGRDDDCKLAVREMYVKKTRDRLEKIRYQSEFEQFFSQPICINGQEYPSLDDTLNSLSALVEDLLVQDAGEQFCIIHGDLCFTNILIENSLNFMRFIDPRGKFGGFDIYGDSRYELAKIMHTLEGKYDYIIEDMFDVTVDGTNITYSVHLGEKDILSSFLDVFKDRLTKVQAVRLIESTLFLSMIPLHSDYLTRQYAMLATGVQLFWKVMHTEA